MNDADVTSRRLSEFDLKFFLTPATARFVQQLAQLHAGLV
jgi:hypothetical protein